MTDNTSAMIVSVKKRKVVKLNDMNYTYKQEYSMVMMNISYYHDYKYHPRLNRINFLFGQLCKKFHEPVSGVL